MSVRQFLKSQFQPPDDLLLEAGAVGEILVARIRLVTVALICLMPPIAFFSGSPKHEVVTGAVVALSAFLMATILLRQARREGSNVRWRFISAAFDITAVSLVLGLFLFQGFPQVAIRSLDSFLLSPPPCWRCPAYSRPESSSYSQARTS